MTILRAERCIDCTSPFFLSAVVSGATLLSYLFCLPAVHSIQWYESGEVASGGLGDRRPETDIAILRALCRLPLRLSAGTPTESSSIMAGSTTNKSTKVQWTPEQIEALKAAVSRHEDKWIKVAEEVPGRNAKECR